MFRWPFVALALLLSSVAVGRASDELACELVPRNIEEMPYSAHVRIVASAHFADIRADDGSAGYVVLKIRGKVLETFKGPRLEYIEYLQTVESPASRPAVNVELIVSLARSAKGMYSIADNGYVFAATSKRIAIARKAATRQPLRPIAPQSAAPVERQR